MTLGCFLAGAAYLVAAHGTGPEERCSVAWLIGTIFILTMREFYLSPIGLSLSSKISRK
jgi:dipeptide/tripeptide permease